MFSYQKEQAWVSAMKNPDSEFKVNPNATLYSFIEDTDFEYVNENVIENKSYHIFKGSTTISLVCITYEIHMAMSLERFKRYC
jgi:hypothetical protein